MSQRNGLTARTIEQAFAGLAVVCPQFLAPSGNQHLCGCASIVGGGCAWRAAGEIHRVTGWRKNGGRAIHVHEAL